MNTSPASIVGGISTATSVFRISFSRTILKSTCWVAYSAGGSAVGLDPRHLSCTSTASRIKPYDDPEMVSVERHAAFDLSVSASEAETVSSRVIDRTEDMPRFTA
jgi:hypothetical protein